MTIESMRRNTVFTERKERLRRDALRLHYAPLRIIRVATPGLLLLMMTSPAVDSLQHETVSFFKFSSGPKVYNTLSRYGGCTPFSSAFPALASNKEENQIESLKQDNQDEEDQLKLFNSLDNAFDYEGRLNAGFVRTRPDFRSGFVSVIGAPNMGKSTLVNALIEEELCIATRRPQTTRHSILGIITTEDCQLCLLDTPGILENPAYKLQEGMMEAVKGALSDADVLLVVTDLFSTPIPDDEIFMKIQKTSKPVLVVINKVDLVDRVSNREDTEESEKTTTIVEAVGKWRSLLPNALAILPVCALDGANDPGVMAIRKLLLGGGDLPAALRNLGRPVPGMFVPGVKFITDEEATRMLPKSPPLYEDDILTDRTQRFVASEIIRASLFEHFKKELPYCCEVQVTAFKEPKVNEKKQVIRIDALIIVERGSQKIIVIGRKGDQVKKVGILARQKLEEFLQTKASL